MKYPRYLALGSLIFLMAGCATHNSISPPTASLPETFSQSGAEAQSNLWWQSFDDPQLNSLIDKALTDNFSLKAATDRLRQAEAVAKQSGASTVPSLEATFDGSHTHQSSGNVDQFQIGLMASYEIDLWSRLAASEVSAEFDFMASREELETAAITLSSEVASSWYELVTQESLIKLYDQQIENLTNQLSVIELRYRYGQTQAEDLLQQKQLLENLNAKKLAAQSQKQLITQQLALLTGVTDLPALYIPEAPELSPLPSTGLPAELLNRRPDLKQAWFNVQSQSQQLIVAEADRLPQLSLTASLLSSSADFSSLMNDWASNLAAGIVAPLFDGGMRKAEVERQEAALSESLNTYSQTVLEAFSEVESALTQEQSEQQQLQSINKQLSLALKTEQIKLTRYQNGDSTFLEVLTAQNSRLDLEQQKLISRGNLLAERIQLHRSLAGDLNAEKLTRKGSTASTETDKAQVNN
ncbi:efflux transporter outer membrane subunit [Endozoicomonas arenosclerae]|uniref:efflux transporter outer membrane subunit n=1 Tax=Endozoicomonas arenosclerae TaxID=1633495 RepID=UPI000B207750|nr:TolC family protein [Endozoicomonas arenosclerae]